MLVADADVPHQVIAALQAVRYDIKLYSELNLPVRPDEALADGVKQLGGILLTMDLGIPSDAYIEALARGGLTVVVLRWKQSRPVDWQEMVVAILKEGAAWAAAAAEAPCVISVNRTRTRIRRWDDLPPRPRVTGTRVGDEA